MFHTHFDEKTHITDPVITLRKDSDKGESYTPDVKIMFEVGGSDSYYATVFIQLDDTGGFYDDDAEVPETLYDSSVSAHNNDTVSLLDVTKATQLAVERFYDLKLNEKYRMIGEYGSGR